MFLFGEQGKNEEEEEEEKEEEEEEETSTVDDIQDECHMYPMLQCAGLGIFRVGAGLKNLGWRDGAREAVKTDEKCSTDRD